MGWPSMRYVVQVEEERVNCRAARAHLEQLSDFQFEHYVAKESRSS